ncbi:hypothetical protein EON83_27095 [bacterium]|nr:MAG: hypothetical protein EON83_27095 [bacterium]
MLLFVLFALFPALRDSVVAMAPLARIQLQRFLAFLATRARVFLMLFLAVSTVIGTASAAEGLEAKRVAQNKTNLAKMSPTVRAKVAAVISDDEANGYKPIIDNAVWRSKAEQYALYKKGYSKVTFSFHNASTPSGQADSLAADITDQRYGWTGLAPKRFWMVQARSARVHGLYSGAHFGLSSENKRKLDAALDARNFAYSGPLGWDVAHVEPTGITLGQAKAGKRPYSQ